MGRNFTPRGKVVRRLGVNIFGNPKFDRILEKRPYGPGQHGKKRRKMSNYGTQLLEKQKVKKMYGVLEKQFRKYFHEAERRKGVTGHNLLQILECRLDNAVFKAGFAKTRDAARQIVRHGHIQVKGRKVNLPSFLISQNDIISIKGKENTKKLVNGNIKSTEDRIIPNWMDVDKEKLLIKITKLPERADIEVAIEEQLIVELYSK
ncbi:MAG: 30S ribosomal protein S4 [Candidatus Kappaea frigidicola]|nr:30S ribosomal protein S4 [Candidatus Kappaea frigidicola]